MQQISFPACAPSSGGPAVRPPLEALTGLRFIAALVVVVSHFPELVPIAGAAEALDRQGAAGVTVFFVLSGFVLTYNYFDRFRGGNGGTGGFLRARVARIFPMHVFSLVLVTVIVLGLSADPPSWGSWILNLLMLQSVLPVKATHLWNIPSWSVSVELFMYLAFPFLVWSVLRRLSRPKQLLAVGGAIFAIEVALFCTVALTADRVLAGRGRSTEDITMMLKRVAFFPGLRVWEFFLGCVLGLSFLQSRATGQRAWWRFADRRRTRNALLRTAALGYLVILIVPMMVDLPTRGLLAHLATPGLYVLYTPLAVITVMTLAWGPTAVSGVLRRPLMQRLGEASYSLYLLQWSAILLVTQGAWAPSPRTWWFSGIVVVVLIGASLVTARWIEQPGRRLLRGTPAAGVVAR